MYSPFAHLSFWHAAASSPAEPPRAYPFASAGSEVNDISARNLASRLQASEPEARRELLGVLHGRSALLPWASVHSSWLADILADAPASWKGWALAVLPAAVREPLVADDESEPGGRSTDARPPAWWPAWFNAHVKRRLGYPDLPPWPVAAPLPGSLWESDEATLSRLLAVRGTRGMMSALRALPREEAQQWIWGLPAACRSVADQTVRERRWSEDPFWPEVFGVLADEFPDPEPRLIRMALADLMRAGVQQGQEIELRRLSFRLPRRWGAWMLVELAARPDWLARPVLPSIDAWRTALERDLDERPASPEVAT